MLLLVAPLAAGAEAGGLNEIRLIRLAEGAPETLEIVGSRRPNFTSFTMAAPQRLVIDFADATFRGVPSSIAFDSSLVESVRTSSHGSHQASIARVVVRFRQEVDTDVRTDGGTLTVIARATDQPPRLADASQALEQARSPDAEAAGLAEEKRKQEEAARLAEEKRKQEEAARLAEEQRKREEAARIAEEKRKQEEAARLAEEKRKQEEAARLAEEQRKREEAARLAEEQRKREEAARIAEEQRKREEAARLAEEQRKREEAARLAEEQRKREEAARLAEERRKREEAARLAEERRKREEAARLAEERRRQQAQAEARPEPEPVRGTVETVGFRKLGNVSRVFVRTMGEVGYAVREVGGDTVVLTLERTTIGKRNNARALDTRFFDSTVLFVDPQTPAKGTVTVEIKLKQLVPYQVRRDGNEIHIDFEEI